ncbi:MAG: flavin reductase family protein [Rubripirellula sp.]
MTLAADQLFRSLDSVTWLITSRSGDRTGGLIATYVTQASIVDDRPRLMVGLAKHHWTQQLIAESGVFVAHLISEHQIEWALPFGTCSGRDVDKLAGLATESHATGAPVLADAAGWLECRVEQGMDAGDRQWYLAEVVEASWTKDFKPLTISRLLQLVDDDTAETLEKQYCQDSLIDREEIDRWRAGRKSP